MTDNNNNGKDYETAARIYREAYLNTGFSEKSAYLLKLAGEDLDAGKFSQSIALSEAAILAEDYYHREISEGKPPYERMIEDAQDLLGVTVKKSRPNIGTEYVNANGQLYHPGLVSSYSDVFTKPIEDYETWIEISQETAAAHVRDQFWTFRKDREVDLLDSKIYRDVFTPTTYDYEFTVDGPEAPDLVAWAFKGDTIEDPVGFVTLLQFRDGVDIVIETDIYFPFPEVAQVRVIVVGSEGLDYRLIGDMATIDNLDHYARAWNEATNETSPCQTCPHVGGCRESGERNDCPY
jgi:hypothetical protein